MPNMDPFLLLDEFKSENADDYIKGFPDHPHRGFETVTYMLEGAMEHRDHSGNVGLLGAGGVQWMTAGSGVVHSEMPRIENGLMWGFQLWVNLPAAKKMCRPRYQDFAPEQIPVAALPLAALPLASPHLHTGSVKVIAGKWRGEEGPVQDIASAPLFLDVRLDGCSGGQQQPFVAELQGGHNAFLFVYKGTALVAQGPDDWREVREGHIATFEMAAEDSPLTVSSHSAAHFLLVAAKPWGEPIQRPGPFVMNTPEEIAQAFDELRAGTFLLMPCPLQCPHMLVTSSYIRSMVVAKHGRVAVHVLGEPLEP